MRVLAVDHGTARCGCAISDPSGTLARPLPVIEPCEPREVAELVAEHGVELVVVLVDVPVQTHDERFTTTMAEASARSGADAAEDSLAAAHLLESFLASERKEP